MTTTATQEAPKRQSEYLDVNINVGVDDPNSKVAKEINITRIGLTEWQSPDGKVRRIYVSGKPNGWKKGEQWPKLGYISNDRDESNLGDMDDLSRNAVIKTARAMLR